MKGTLTNWTFYFLGNGGEGESKAIVDMIAKLDKPKAIQSYFRRFVMKISEINGNYELARQLVTGAFAHFRVKGGDEKRVEIWSKALDVYFLRSNDLQQFLAWDHAKELERRLEKREDLIFNDPCLLYNTTLDELCRQRGRRLQERIGDIEKLIPLAKGDCRRDLKSLKVTLRRLI